jgi:hypothetical protein
VLTDVPLSNLGLKSPDYSIIRLCAGQVAEFGASLNAAAICGASRLRSYLSFPPRLGVDGPQDRCRYGRCRDF